jgi:hypothetical protein
MTKNAYCIFKLKDKPEVYQGTYVGAYRDYIFIKPSNFSTAHCADPFVPAASIDWIDYICDDGPCLTKREFLDKLVKKLK